MDTKPAPEVVSPDVRQGAAAPIEEPHCRCGHRRAIHLKEQPRPCGAVTFAGPCGCQGYYGDG